MSWLRSRRSYAPVLLVGLVAAGAVALAVSRTWVTATAAPAGLPRITATVSGAEIEPLVAALGFVLLAGTAAVIASRGLGRRLVGMVLVASACLAVVLTVTSGSGDAQPAARAALSARGWSGGPYDTATSVWWWVACAGSAVCVLVGLAVTWAAGVWPVMGDRYASPGAASESAVDAARTNDADDLTEAQLWRALDEGHDPTR